MKRIYLYLLLLVVFAPRHAVCQGIEWIDTLRYETEIRVYDLKVSPGGNLTVLGAYGGGYSAPDLSRTRTFVESRAGNGHIKWRNNGIYVSGQFSNIAVDEHDNVFLATWLSASSNVTPTIGNNTYEPGTYLIRLAADGSIGAVSEKHSTHTVPGMLRLMLSGQVEVCSQIPGGAIKHIYDSACHLISTQTAPKLLYAQYDKYGNGYQRYGENGQVYLIKYDAAEKELWRLAINNQTGFTLDSEGNLYLVEQGPYLSSSVAKLNAQGQLQWSRQYATQCGFRATTDDANLYLIGVFGTQEEVHGGVVKKLDLSTGAEIWSTTINNALFRPVNIVCAKGIIYASANNIEENKEAYVVKIVDSQWQEPDTITTTLAEDHLIPEFSIFPNPCKDGFTISGPSDCRFSYEVIDVAGKVVQAAECAGDKEVHLKHAAKGFYTVRILPEVGPEQTKRLVVE